MEFTFRAIMGVTGFEMVSRLFPEGVGNASCVLCETTTGEIWHFYRKTGLLNPMKTCNPEDCIFS